MLSEMPKYWEDRKKKQQQRIWEAFLVLAQDIAFLCIYRAHWWCLLIFSVLGVIPLLLFVFRALDYYKEYIRGNKA